MTNMLIENRKELTFAWVRLKPTLILKEVKERIVDDNLMNNTITRNYVTNMINDKQMEKLDFEHELKKTI